LIHNSPFTIEIEDSPQFVSERNIDHSQLTTDN
jgi:hypothetical protein